MGCLPVGVEASPVGDDVLRPWPVPSPGGGGWCLVGWPLPELLLALPEGGWWCLAGCLEGLVGVPDPPVGGEVLRPWPSPGGGGWCLVGWPLPDVPLALPGDGWRLVGRLEGFTVGVPDPPVGGDVLWPGPVPSLGGGGLLWRGEPLVPLAWPGGGGLGGWCLGGGGMWSAFGGARWCLVGFPEPPVGEDVLRPWSVPSPGGGGGGWSGWGGGCDGCSGWGAGGGFAGGGGLTAGGGGEAAADARPAWQTSQLPGVMTMCVTSCKMLLHPI